MDEISTINITKDSTFAILLEAQNRGHEIFYYLPENLGLEANILKANIHKIKLQNKIGNHVEILASKFDDLTNYDLLLVRQDPPINLNYLTNTYLLEKIKDQILILNDPTEIRNCPEKIFVTDFSDLTPPTLITSNFEQIKNFHHKHGNIIIKPLYGNGGDSVFYLHESDKNLIVLADLMKRFYQAPMIAQKFLPQVKDGDKRILLLDGEVIGAVSRIASANEIRSNFHAGGTAKKAELTKREEFICKRIGPELKKRGLTFVGIDVIGDYLTEINVTSPTGIHEINHLNGTKIETQILECFERKFLERRT